MSETQNKKTLFIYDLDNTITDKQLTQAFREEGYNVNYIRVNKSKYANGLNTAFVNFETEESAAKALETLNHLTLGKTELFIVYATNKPVGQQFVSNPKKTVFVKGLPTDIETVVLIKIFTSMFGDIENLRVMRDSNNVSRGYGYITFKNEEDAQKAIGLGRNQENRPEKTEFEINGQRKSFDFEFQEYLSKDSRPEMWTNTYIRNLPNEWHKEELIELAKKVGEPRSVIINDKPDLGLHYGFASFKSHDDAERFLALDSKPIDIETKEVVQNPEEVDPSKYFKPYVSQYENKDERKKNVVTLKNKNCGLFIVEFGKDINLNDVNVEFDKYGKIYSSTLYKEPKPGQTFPLGADSRFPRALVLYKDPASAAKAIKGSNGALAINGKPLEHELEVKEYKSHARKNDAGSETKGQRSKRTNVPQPVESNVDNRPIPEASQAVRQLTDQEVRDKLSADVKKYLEERAPEHKDELDKFLGIFNEMLEIDEMRKCVDKTNYLEDYMKAILSEMTKTE